MKTIIGLAILFWIAVIVSLIMALKHHWEWYWAVLPVVSVIMLGVIYGLIYKENKP